MASVTVKDFTSRRHSPFLPIKELSRDPCLRPTLPSTKSLRMKALFTSDDGGSFSRHCTGLCSTSWEKGLHFLRWKGVPAVRPRPLGRTGLSGLQVCFPSGADTTGYCCAWPSNGHSLDPHRPAGGTLLISPWRETSRRESTSPASVTQPEAAGPRHRAGESL